MSAVAEAGSYGYIVPVDTPAAAVAGPSNV